MKAIDVQNYLFSLAKVKEKSVDRVVIGDPETVVKKIATCWTPYWETCKQAVADGVNLLVTHEPTFYSHWDLDNENQDHMRAPDAAKNYYLEQIAKKKQWIDENGLVIIRCHDVPDKIEGWGIPFALGQALGFKNEDIIKSKTYFNVYKTEPKTAYEMAKMIAEKLGQEAAQPGVGFYGDPERIVKSLGLGTGYMCDTQLYKELNPDMSIMINDTLRTWIHGEFATDTGDPLVVIDHGAAEEFGMRKVNKKLNERFPDMEITHIKQGCGYRWIS